MMHAAWRWSCGIDLGSRGANLAAPKMTGTGSLWMSIQWVPNASVQVQCKHQLQMDSRTGQVWISVFQNQQISCWIPPLVCSICWHTRKSGMGWWLCHWLANRKVRQVALEAVSFEMPYQILHFSDHLLSDLEFYIKSVEVLYYVTFKMPSRSAIFHLQARGWPFVCFPWNERSLCGIITYSQHFTLT